LLQERRALHALQITQLNGKSKLKKRIDPKSEQGVMKAFIVACVGCMRSSKTRRQRLVARRIFGSPMNISRRLAASGREHTTLRPASKAFGKISFHNYADYAMGAGFQFGFTRLRELGSVRRSVVMCAEALWWQCHRRIIADYLLIAGERVFHILEPKAITPASLRWVQDHSLTAG
jgi:hypothetical protein